MVAIHAGIGAGSYGAKKAGKSPEKTRIDPMFWGYIIRGSGLGNVVTLASQIAAAGVGTMLVLSSLIFWSVTGTAHVVHFGGLEYGMSIVLFLFGMVLIWFASHGTNFEFHVNIKDQELREMVRNAKGKTRLLRVIPFDNVSSVFLDRPTQSGGKVRLSLRLRSCSKVVAIATDTENKLQPIHAQLVRDVLPMAQGAYAQAHVGNTLFEPMLNTVIPRRVVTRPPVRGFMFAKAQGVIVPRRVVLAT